MQLFITEWLSGDTATGRVMVTRKQRISSQCPCCNAEDEHLLHVITCHAPETICLRNRLVHELLLWMAKDDTHPDIITFVELGLQQWFINQDFTWTQGSHIFTTCPAINKAFQRQLQVVWYYFLCGLVTKDLIAVQQHHYTTLSMRGSRLQCRGVKLILKY